MAAAGWPGNMPALQQEASNVGGLGRECRARRAVLCLVTSVLTHCNRLARPANIGDGDLRGQPRQLITASAVTAGRSHRAFFGRLDAFFS